MVTSQIRFTYLFPSMSHVLFIATYKSCLLHITQSIASCYLSKLFHSPRMVPKHAQLIDEPCQYLLKVKYIFGCMPIMCCIIGSLYLMFIHVIRLYLVDIYRSRLLINQYAMLLCLYNQITQCVVSVHVIDHFQLCIICHYNSKLYQIEMHIILLIVLVEYMFIG